MPNYVITSKRDPKFSVRVDGCDPKHAQSVLEQLLVEPTVPSDLTLTELDKPKRPWWRRGKRV